MKPDLAQLLARPIAHRGLHGCGRGGPVENSLGAARAAAAAGFGVECDVLLSKDGEAMVFHDAGLERLTGATGFVAERAASDLANLHLGGTDDRIPTLGSLLATIAGRVPLVIEIKACAGLDRLTDRVLALTDDYEGPVAIESFAPSAVRRALQATRRPVGLVGPEEEDGPSDLALASSCDFLSWSIAELAQARATWPDLPFSTWTVRSPMQSDLAARHRAQIVFEGFDPH